MLYDKGMSQEMIASRILNIPTLYNQVSNFIYELNQTGVIRLFINTEKLDEFMEELKKRNILTGDFEWIDFSSKNLTINLIEEFAYYFAERLFYTQIYETSDLLPMLEGIIRSMKIPAGVNNLHYAIFNYVAKISNAYLEALSVYCESYPEQFDLLRGMMLAALPASGKPTINCGFWVCTKYRTFEKIDFQSILENEPFDDCYKSFFQNASVTLSGYSKEKLHEDVLYFFKCFLIDEIFKVITNSKKRTSKNISRALQEMRQNRSIYIYVLYVRAFFLAFLEEFERLKFQNTSSNVINTISVSIDNRYNKFPS